MPVRSDEPLRKVTLNLYETDCQWFEQNYGRGWTERVRQELHNDVVTRQTYKRGVTYGRHAKRTLGDLSHDE